MRKLLLFLGGLAFFSSFLLSCNQTRTYAPDNHLSAAQQDSFKYEIIRFVGRLPKRATYATKFESRFDEPYRLMARAMELDKYYYNPSDDYIYFEMSRIAPSLYEKYVATGGRLKRDDQGKIVEYEEIYRTWKMAREDLEEKTAIFFDHMVKGKDLSSFYTVNVGDTEHIEFPDEHTYFDKNERRWIRKNFSIN
ncbi:hypothetical protein ACFOET_11100 [Parapedobacter deserti]|uniref:Lipoprotein n=1 Tax=Parapedobacter deserti TaxID=1912957 RepID=A0ABV7JPA4_9SPHI